MSKVTRFEELIAWQEARRLNAAIYVLVAGSPLRGDRPLCDQLRRAALSVMTNIAEGFGCESMHEFGRFLVIARRSAVEVQSLLYSTLDAKHVPQSVFEMHYRHAARVHYLINQLYRSLSR